MLSCHIIFKRILRITSFFNINIFAFTMMMNVTACQTTSEEDSDDEESTIANPFAKSTKPLGKDPDSKRMVIRSATGSAEYAVELPESSTDYDVEVPIAREAADELGGGGPRSKQGKVGNPSAADRELVDSLPRGDQRYPEEAGSLDQAFGVAQDGGPRQSPSYTLGLAKINGHYKKREYEYALIETNNMIAFYPNSPKLHKMKGTIFIKMGQYELAEKAWLKAQQLDPSDQSLSTGLKRLQKKLGDNRQKAIAPSAEQPAAIDPLAP